MNIWKNIIVTALSLLLFAAGTKASACPDGTLVAETDRTAISYDLTPYENMKDVLCVKLNKTMLGLAASLGESELTKGLGVELLRSLNRMTVVVGNTSKFQKAYAKDIKALQGSHYYEEVLTASRGGAKETTVVFGHHHDDVISELLLFAQKNGDGIIVQVLGDITPEMVAELVKVYSGSK